MERERAVVTPHDWLENATISDLQAKMTERRLSSRDLVQMYLERTSALNENGPALHAVIEVNPDAVEIASQLDQERAETGPRGPLHGVPVLVKDNIDTADKMQTTAGSLALLGHPPTTDAFVVRGLRKAGAIILGKANMSEWANFRSTRSSSGWSARGGQALNPYSLERSPGGSSSGSASAVAAALAAGSLGTETDGSIISPASVNGIVGIKPTVGLTSRSGVIPISHSQDTVGTMGRTVADAAALLGAITGVDPEDCATSASAGRFHGDYTRFLDTNGLRGARIGVARDVYFGPSDHSDAVVEKALAVMRAAGAEVVDPASIPSAHAMLASPSEEEVLLFEFKADIEAYFTRYRPGAPVQSLSDLITFNDAHAEQEMRFFGQELFLLSQEKGTLSEKAYLDWLAESRRLSRDEGIDAVMDRHGLDALVMPSRSPAWKIDLINGDQTPMGTTQAPAMAGYPVVTVPAGYAHGLPVGVSFVGKAFSEPTLIRLAYAFEQLTNVRVPPRFRPSTL